MGAGTHAGCQPVRSAQSKAARDGFAAGALEKLLMKIAEFYDQEVRVLWDSRPWDQFMKWAKRFREWDGFDADERDYKLAIADRVASGRIEVAAAVDLLDDLAWRGLAGRKKAE